ncbi:MAG: glucuronate isomerase [Defluviitaleaceae bacterium]|nr:glucuronate isomerase [Defluviitaleaceae bacterium]
MKEFLGDDFLLQSELAIALYEQVKDLPIVDYHCHLEPSEIAENKRFENITEIWLYGDHYKWRLMRANGVDEHYITGDATDWEKFEKWAETIDDCIGNPLYHWTHLELKRYFDYHGLLSAKTAKEVWEICNAKISEESFCVHGILDKFKVEMIGTTDDPADSLEHHETIINSGLATKVLPTLRPGHLYNVDSPNFVPYLDKLSEVSGVEIDNYSDLMLAMQKRVDFFHEMGCRASDIGMDTVVYEEYSTFEIDVIFNKAINGKALTQEEIDKYRTSLMVDLGMMYADKGWAVQYHMNALRNNNSIMFEDLGADKGYDSISDTDLAKPLARLLDELAKEGKLAKSILYSLNPAQDDIITTMIGNFQGGGVKGKMQHGSAWWVNDTKTGMEKQMISLANNGMLARFIGMLTDSRSFLSYPRHEYFRRIMVNLLANWVIAGEFPNDFEKLSQIAKDIAYFNAKDYFEY